MTAKDTAFGWAWQDKRALRRIRELLEDNATALALYLALTEQASNSTSPEFTASHAQLASLSGLSVRTVQRRLLDLKRINLVGISTPRLREPSTFTLFAADPSGSKLKPRSLGHSGGTFGHGNASPWPTLEEPKRGNSEPEPSTNRGGLMSAYQDALRRFEEGGSR
jgi:hypothetical protein